MWIETDFPFSNMSVMSSADLKIAADKINLYISDILENDGSFRREGKLCAFVTVATPSYDFGLKALLASIRRHSSIPIIVLASRRWAFETGLPGVYLLVVPSLHHEEYAPLRPEIRISLTKLWIFGMLSLRRIVFLDADCLVVKPIDELFDASGLCCAADCIESSESARLNSGLIAFDPSPELRNLVFEKAHETPSYDHGDQGMLDIILRPMVKYLPSEYNFTRHYSFFHGPEASPEAARVIHYIVKKPWELWYRETPDVALVDLDDLWTSQLSREELLQLISFWRRRQFIAERPRFEALHQRGSHLIHTWSQIFRNSRRFRYFVALMVSVACLSLAMLVCLEIVWIFGWFRS